MSAEIAMHKRGYILPVVDHSTHAKRILLVDDDVDILGVAAEMLETLGYDVIVARTGLEALALLRDNSASPFCLPISKCQAWEARSLRE